MGLMAYDLGFRDPQASEFCVWGVWENLEFRGLRFEGRFLDIGSLRS